MNIYNFMAEYWDIVILFFVVVFSILYLIYKGEKGIVFKMLYVLVTEAEKDFGDGTGILKLATVIEKVYPKLPPLIKTFISASKLEGWTEDVLNKAKETWKNNSDIAAYIRDKNNR